jgi:hypothetical protein
LQKETSFADEVNLTETPQRLGRGTAGVSGRRVLEYFIRSPENLFIRVRPCNIGRVHVQHFTQTLNLKCV